MRVALFLATGERRQEQSMRECPFFLYFIYIFVFRKKHIKAAISEHFSCDPEKCTQMEEEGLLLRVTIFFQNTKKPC